jgi:hypothetical protein
VSRRHRHLAPLFPLGGFLIKPNHTYCKPERDMVPLLTTGQSSAPHDPLRRPANLFRIQPPTHQFLVSIINRLWPSSDLPVLTDSNPHARTPYLPGLCKAYSPSDARLGQVENRLLLLARDRGRASLSIPPCGPSTSDRRRSSAMPRLRLPSSARTHVRESISRS